jgi:predicted 3-demethylubiquinone-9 3-methyltransferase (glyoxalase superfamily)
MQKIIPHLWYDTQAVEAAKWYVSLFDDSRIIEISSISDTPSGDVDTVEFELGGVHLSAISAGPYFSLNSAISLMVTCHSAEEVDLIYKSLSVGAEILMPIGAYPFSKRYVWLADKYGLNWQLSYFETNEISQKIRPVLLFAGDGCGKAEEALRYYIGVFRDANLGYVSHYLPEEPHDPRAKVNYAECSLFGFQFVAMDHGMGGDEPFNEAFSLMVLCDGQAEIDDYWNKLSAVPDAEQCGWLKDQFGFSWQIVPKNMSDLLASASREEGQRIMQAFLEMKKIDIAALERARRG